MAELNKWGIERPHRSIITLIGCVSSSSEGKGVFLLAPPASRRYFGLADSSDTCFTQAMCASKFPDGKMGFLVNFLVLVLVESQIWLDPWALISSFGIYKYSRALDRESETKTAAAHVFQNIWYIPEIALNSCRTWSGIFSRLSKNIFRKYFSWFYLSSPPAPHHSAFIFNAYEHN